MKAIENQLARAKRMESLGVLAGGVAHDLNNILCGIVGYPDMLLLDCTEEGFLKTSLLEIKKSGEKAATFVPPGRVCLTTENRFLDHPLRGYDHVKPGEYVTLTVADTGAGISPEDRERIFEPFYTKKVMGRSGTGLGMAVVWGTVKDHQGYILVESEVGQGSSMVLYLPASRRELPAQEKAPGVAHYAGRGETILVVDDLPEQTTLVSKMLERLGYRVHAVQSGEAAVEHLKAGAADLVILDMIMDPGMDGLDTYRLIHSMRPKLRVIITSGYSETNRVREALRLGAGPYIKKPFRLETLARIVHEALAPGQT
jgi:CheY-like chemotaxis protein